MGTPSITLSAGGGFLLEPTGSVTIFTPEMLSDEQRMMKETADDFVIREVLPRVADIEAKKPGLMRELLQKAGAVGLLGHDVPEEFGGLGGDKTSSSLITEAASRSGSFAVSFGAHVGIGTMPIVLFGTLEQRKKYLPKLASGEMIAAYAPTEPGSGSDALAAKTKAIKSADGTSWKLTGSKLYITHAGFADLFTVFAKVDGEQFTAFLVERNAPGLTIGPEEHKLGIRGSSTCPLFLEDCTIPIDAVLGTIGQGHKIAFNILNIGRWKLGVGSVAGAKYCLELGVKFARERKQFGKPIAEFDLIRKKIGDIATQTFVAESMAFRTAGLLEPGTMLKRAMMGRLPLMAFVGQVQQELADLIKIDRRIPDGPLGREKKKCDFAKRAIAYGASLGVQKYMQAISEKQELLGVLADSIILTFGMDSAISRTLQLIAAKGEAASQIPIYMTQLFVAKAHEQVFVMLREMMMWMSQDEEWGREIRDINNYYNLDRINTFSLRRKVAKHVIEAGGYAL